MNYAYQKIVYMFGNMQYILPTLKFPYVHTIALHFEL
ncbi:hypothetical protein SDC9_190613 [bioreactor metagenome]|uniref:Uncharacterized protein n=1 Tax=bioreactor metagenome TaxID=1076179 RepID=A0A645I3S5_9ZZZZ